MVQPKTSVLGHFTNQPFYFHPGRPHPVYMMAIALTTHFTVKVGLSDSASGPSSIFWTRTDLAAELNGWTGLALSPITITIISHSGSSVEQGPRPTSSRTLLLGDQQTNGRRVFLDIKSLDRCPTPKGRRLEVSKHDES